ncbi:MAG: hypothetical protein ACI4TU_07795, partial [Candidatus Cryptobacteroides sp.]
MDDFEVVPVVVKVNRWQLPKLELYLQVIIILLCQFLITFEDCIFSVNLLHLPRRNMPAGK